MDKHIEELKEHKIVKLEEELDKNQKVWYHIICKDNFTLESRKEGNHFKLSPKDKQEIINEIEINTSQKGESLDKIDFDALAKVTSFSSGIGNVRLNSSLLTGTWYLEQQAQSIVNNPLLKARYAEIDDIENPEAVNPRAGDISQCVSGKVIKYNNLVLVVQPKAVKEFIAKQDARRSEFELAALENSISEEFTNNKQKK